MYGQGFRVKDLGFLVQGLRVSAFGFGVWGKVLEFRV